MSLSSAKLTAIRYLATQTAPFLLRGLICRRANERCRATDSRLLMLTRLLEHVARTQHHKAQIRYLRKMIEAQQPGDPLWTSDEDMPQAATKG